MKEVKWLGGIILLFLVIFAGLFVACQNEDYDTFQTEGLDVGVQFLKLSDDDTNIAGKLVINAGTPEIDIKWNTESLCNIDTAQTKISVKNGICTLPIKWKEKLANGSYGPNGIAYKAGVQITAGKYSKYVPLIWAEQIDSTKVMESIPLTRAAGDPMPRVTQITMVPSTVNMNEELGGSMYVGLSNVAFAIFDWSEFSTDMNIDMSMLPTSITASQMLDFKWKAGGAPAFEFSARVIAMSEGLTQTGIVQFVRTPSQITLAANPTTLNLTSNNGAQGSSVITTNDSQGWSASISEGDWFTITTSGVGGGTLVATASSANNTGASRTGKITVSSKSSPSIQTIITVVQAANAGPDPDKVYNLKVMTIGGLAIGSGGIKVGPNNPVSPPFGGEPYINGLGDLLANNFGAYALAKYNLTIYNYYSGGYSPAANSKDFAGMVSMLRTYDIDIACLFFDWNASPTVQQASELLAWLNEKPTRGLIFSFDYPASQTGLTSVLGLYDRKMGGGVGAFSIAHSFSGNETFKAITQGRFGNITYSNFRSVDNDYGNVSVGVCQNAGFVPILLDSQGRVVAAANPEKRIFFHGETQFCQKPVIGNGTMSTTAYGAYAQLIGNMWAWLCGEVAAGK